MTLTSYMRGSIIHTSLNKLPAPSSRISRFQLGEEVGGKEHMVLILYIGVT